MFIHMHIFTLTCVCTCSHLNMFYTWVYMIIHKIPSSKLTFATESRHVWYSVAASLRPRHGAVPGSHGLQQLGLGRLPYAAAGGGAMMKR